MLRDLPKEIQEAYEYYSSQIIIYRRWYEKTEIVLFYNKTESLLKFYKSGNKNFIELVIIFSFLKRINTATGGLIYNQRLEVEEIIKEYINKYD